MSTSKDSIKKRSVECMTSPFNLEILVPKKGLEPPHPCGYMDLNHARLPIPPLRHGWKRVLTINSLFRKQAYCTSGLARLAIALRCSPFAVRQTKSAILSENRMAKSGSSACRLRRFAGAVRSVLFQLIVQGLQADAEDLRGAGLVIVGCFQRLQDEQALGLINCGADAEPNRVGFLHRRARNHLSETRWEVLGLDQRTFAYDHGALQRVAQFANVPWPCVCRERIHHRFGHSCNPAIVLLVHVGHQCLDKIGQIL